MRNNTYLITKRKEIIPNRVIFGNELNEIVELDNKYKITEYYITVTEVNNGYQITKVQIDTIHPNSNPDTSEFCIPKGIKYDNERTPKELERMFKTFNLNDCYFQPWEDFKFKKGFSNNER